MYDAIDDPYTYENSTVLVNKLDLHEQAELDAFVAEISSARADEPLPEGNLDFTHYPRAANDGHAERTQKAMQSIDDFHRLPLRPQKDFG
jgi:hypothetical protein